MDVCQKEQALGKLLSQVGPAVVCYSGGVDSTFLLAKVAFYSSAQVIAVIINSESMPPSELNQAVRVSTEMGIDPVVIPVEELAIPQLASNPPDRCYFCKQLSYGRIGKYAQSIGVSQLLDGTNADDLKDYRPGLKAKEEFKVLSPLAEVHLTKQEIRSLSKKMGLSTWEKPSSPCLNSRIPYGEWITVEKLDLIAGAEEFIRSLGYKELRVRHHNGLAKIEVERKDFVRILGQADLIEQHLKKLGFKWVSLDLGGFRSGSLNQGLFVEP